jgi:hypothetical protein
MFVQVLSINTSAASVDKVFPMKLKSRTKRGGPTPATNYFIDSRINQVQTILIPENENHRH